MQSLCKLLKRWWLILTSQTSKASLCDQSLALWKRTKAPLRGVPLLTSQTSKASLCDQSLALSQKPPLWGRIRWFWKRTKAPLRGVPHLWGLSQRECKAQECLLL
ncbi:hypothetical protein [Campylobacter vicugnae]|uniref:hypothetical protein n=1 Tax=Campylobacter vicugnae TaxID=1660076 RepID=UPI00254AFD35|nr:hypothetical protein [Campylobacter ovis]MDL0094770.1 hypothetical protein [Campylobacter ovis]